MRWTDARMSYTRRPTWCSRAPGRLPWCLGTSSGARCRFCVMIVSARGMYFMHMCVRIKTPSKTTCPRHLALHAGHLAFLSLLFCMLATCCTTSGKAADQVENDRLPLPTTISLILQCEGHWLSLPTCGPEWLCLVTTPTPYRVSPGCSITIDWHLVGACFEWLRRWWTRGAIRPNTSRSCCPSRSSAEVTTELTERGEQ